MLADLDESHNGWGNNGRVAGFVSSGKELHGRVFDLEETWLFISEKGFEKFDTLINGFVKTDMITTADFMECSFFGASGVEVGKLVFNACLFITVKSENAFTLVFGGFTFGKFVIGTVTCEFGVCDFSFTECFFFVTVSGLLGRECVMFKLFSVDFISQSTK